MKKRIISAIVALLIVIPLIIIGGYAYYFGVGILALIGFNELITVREKEKKIPLVMKIMTLISYLAIALSSMTKSTFDIDYRLFILDIFICLIPIIGFDRKKYDCNDALFLLAGTMLLGISFNFLIIIRNINILYLIYVLLITIMSDTFGHFWGTFIGKIKLCPTVSPNKTVEGMIGGTLFGTFIGSIFFNTFISQEASIFLIIVISLALSIVAQFGDLIFSSIKRKYDVKDFGSIMPGHGGVLDRLDSIIFAILAFSYLISFF